MIHHTCKKPSLIHFLLLIISFFFVGCEKKETPVEQATREKTLLLANGAEPTNLDPAFGNGTNDGAIMRAIFEPLVILDPETLDPLPGVATHWDASPDGLTYTFHLRKDARFSNGDPITAHDFVFTIKRFLSPKLGSPIAELYFEPLNAKEYNSGKVTDFNDVGVKALDDYTLQFKLAYPDPFFVQTMSTEPVAPLHQKTLEKFNATESMNGEWLRPENIVTNGPFIIKEWHTNDYIDVEKNPYYWNKDQVKLNKIRFFAMGDRQTQERAFRAGQLHITDTLPSNLASQYRKHKNPNLRTKYLNGLYAFIFNTRIHPLNDARVRKALSMSIDRQKLAKDVFKDGRKPAYVLTPDVISNYHPTRFVEENVQQAQKLLAEAGFPKGKGFPELELMFHTDDTNLRIAQAIQSMWKKNLNINIKLANTEWKVLIDIMHMHDFQIMRMAWVNLLLDPLTFLLALQKHSTDVPTGWDNPQSIRCFN
jgi:oligopeptide transport system substrate-binding protein